jgi:hypothetical protein
MDIDRLRRASLLGMSSKSAMSLCPVLRFGALATGYEGVTIASVYSN